MLVITFIAERLTNLLRILWSCIEVRCWESVVSASQKPCDDVQMLSAETFGYVHTFAQNPGVYC